MAMLVMAEAVAVLAVLTAAAVWVYTADIGLVAIVPQVIAIFSN
jgi:hypothetical protein